MESELILTIFGSGTSLNSLQMAARTILVFGIGLVLIRISGRRSFGMQVAFDNVLLILLGAILSRAVVGASPFIPTIVAATTISVLHRITGLLAYHSSRWGKFVKGETIPIYKDGKIYPKNMKYCMVTQNDLEASVRLAMNTDKMDDVEAVYMEREGRLSVIRKNHSK